MDKGIKKYVIKRNSIVEMQIHKYTVQKYQLLSLITVAAPQEPIHLPTHFLITH